MSNYNQGRRGGGFNRGGGGNRFGGGRSRGGFGRDRDSQREMFEVTCTKCGKDCQVPFKPTGSKPVLCSDCFRQNDSREGRSNSDSASNSVQLDKINAKLDKIIKVLENLEIVTDEEEMDLEDEDSDEETL